MIFMATTTRSALTMIQVINILTMINIDTEDIENYHMFIKVIIVTVVMTRAMEISAMVMSLLIRVYMKIITRIMIIIRTAMYYLCC
jgi:hypothetical protein